jgi:hypothetical protein
MPICKSQQKKKRFHQANYFDEWEELYKWTCLYFSAARFLLLFFFLRLWGRMRAKNFECISQRFWQKNVYAQNADPSAGESCFDSVQYIYF